MAKGYTQHAASRTITHLHAMGSDWKKQRKIIGWSNCGCNNDFESGVVLDPMCGTGTTCVAAHKLGRKWIGIDLNEKYCEITRKRLGEVGAFSSKMEEFFL